MEEKRVFIKCTLFGNGGKNSEEKLYYFPSLGFSKMYFFSNLQKPFIAFATIKEVLYALSSHLK